MHLSVLKQKYKKHWCLLKTYFIHQQNFIARYEAISSFRLPTANKLLTEEIAEDALRRRKVLLASVCYKEHHCEGLHLKRHPMFAK
jgi:S-adenosylmethionine:diacylglycerol 3-amino-3-carboxypropyl transferase